MNLYQIEESILNCIDEETGEIIDIEKLEELKIARDAKIENIGCWYKSLLAEATALKAESDALLARKKKADAKAEQLKKYLASVLDGQAFDTSKVSMSFRKSKSIEIEDGFVDWAVMNNSDLLRYKDLEPDKTAIKELLKNGAELPFAHMVENTNIQIK